MTSNEKATDDPFGFDSLEPKAVVFNYANATYVVKEATEGAAVKYQSARAACMQVKSSENGDGSQQIALRGVGVLEPLLVGECLFKRTEDAKGIKDVSVSQVVLNAWPAKVVRRLYRWVMEHSELNDVEDTEESLTTEINRLAKKREKVRAQAQAAAKGEDDPNAGTEDTTSTGST